MAQKHWKEQSLITLLGWMPKKYLKERVLILLIGSAIIFGQVYFKYQTWEESKSIESAEPYDGPGQYVDFYIKVWIVAIVVGALMVLKPTFPLFMYPKSLIKGAALHFVFGTDNYRRLIQVMGLFLVVMGSISLLNDLDYIQVMSKSHTYVHTPQTKDYIDDDGNEVHQITWSYYRGISVDMNKDGIIDYQESTFYPGNSQLRNWASNYPTILQKYDTLRIKAFDMDGDNEMDKLECYINRDLRFSSDIEADYKVVDCLENIK